MNEIQQLTLDILESVWTARAFDLSRPVKLEKLKLLCNVSKKLGLKEDFAVIENMTPEQCLKATELYSEEIK